MKNIKFRVWFKNVSLMSPSFIDCLYMEDNLSYIYRLSDFIESEDYKNCTELMQFTGIYDNNGKEIYEGDIVKQSEIYDCMGQLQPNEITVAQLQLHCWCCGLEKEVIGNIWENPELLNG